MSMSSTHGGADDAGVGVAEGVWVLDEAEVDDADAGGKSISIDVDGGDGGVSFLSIGVSVVSSPVSASNAVTKIGEVYMYWR